MGIEVISVIDRGIYEGNSVIDVILRRDNTFVECKGIMIWDNDPEMIPNAYQEWIEAADRGEEGFSTWRGWRNQPRPVPRLPIVQTSRVKSAAQDLYDALESLAGLFDTPIARRRYVGNDFYDEAIQMSRAALKKAGKNAR